MVGSIRRTRYDASINRNKANGMIELTNCILEWLGSMVLTATWVGKDLDGQLVILVDLLPPKQCNHAVSQQKQRDKFDELGGFARALITSNDIQELTIISRYSGSVILRAL